MTKEEENIRRIYDEKFLDYQPELIMAVLINPYDAVGDVKSLLEIIDDLRRELNNIRCGW